MELLIASLLATLAVFNLALVVYAELGRQRAQRFKREIKNAAAELDVDQAEHPNCRSTIIWPADNQAGPCQAIPCELPEGHTGAHQVSTFGQTPAGVTKVNTVDPEPTDTSWRDRQKGIPAGEARHAESLELPARPLQGYGNTVDVLTIGDRQLYQIEGPVQGPRIVDLTRGVYVDLPLLAVGQGDRLLVCPHERTAQVLYQDAGNTHATKRLNVFGSIDVSTVVWNDPEAARAQHHVDQQEAARRRSQASFNVNLDESDVTVTPTGKTTADVAVKINPIVSCAECGHTEHIEDDAAGEATIAAIERHTQECSARKESRQAARLANASGASQEAVEAIAAQSDPEVATRAADKLAGEAYAATRRAKVRDKPAARTLGTANPERPKMVQRGASINPADIARVPSSPAPRTIKTKLGTEKGSRSIDVPEGWVTTKTAATQIGCTTRSLVGAMAKGRIPSRKTGEGKTCPRIVEQSVVDLLTEHFAETGRLRSLTPVSR